MNIQTLKNDIIDMNRELAESKDTLSDEFVERVSKRQTKDRSVYVYLACKRFIRDYEEINDKRKKLWELESYVDKMEEA